MCDILQILSFNNYRNDIFALEFGVDVKAELTSIDARVLPPPVVIFHPLYFRLLNDFNIKLTLPFFIIQLKYHASGKDKTIRPQIGQWNMINAVENTVPLSSYL